MRLLRLSVTAITLIMMAVGCAKVLDVPTPYIGDRLVIFGVLSPDSIPTVLITRTYPTVGTVTLSGKSIDNATVLLMTNNQAISQLYLVEPGRYEARNRVAFVAGQTYSYSVVAAGYPAVVSNPEPIPSAMQSVDRKSVV